MNPALLTETENTIGVEQSAVKALTGLHDALVAAQGDPAAVQKVIDDLASNREALASAIAANPAPAAV